MSRTKIGEFTLDALRTRQSLVKGERLVRHDMTAVLGRQAGLGVRMVKSDDRNGFELTSGFNVQNVNYHFC